MAQTAEQFRAQERRKMRLQAALNAKRNSIMNLVVPAPEPLPGRNIVDANNAEALALANQFPGQNLTDVLNSRAALRTGNDLANMRSTEVEQAARVGDFENQQAQNALDAQVITDPVPVEAAANPISHWLDPMSMRDTGVDYGPGLTPAAAEERYGPGGMYGTTPLPGGLYDQMGISSGMRPSTSMAAPSMAAPRSATDNLTDAIKKIKKRAAIIRGTAALVGGDASAADRYEAEAMASLGVYAGQYAMSQLTPADFKDKQTLFQSLLAKGMPLDQILQVLESGVADAGAPIDIKAPTRKDRVEYIDGVPYKITEEWDSQKGEWFEVSRAKDVKTPLVQMNDGTSTKDFETNFSAVIDDPEGVYRRMKADQLRINELEQTVRQGGLNTGVSAPALLTLGRLIQGIVPDNKTTREIFKGLDSKIGLAEWFDATAKEFIGSKLAMTKGAVSDREMKIFMSMIPSLSTTKE